MMTVGGIQDRTRGNQEIREVTMKGEGRFKLTSFMEEEEKMAV